MDRHRSINTVSSIALKKEEFQNYYFSSLREKFISDGVETSMLNTYIEALGLYNYFHYYWQFQKYPQSSNRFDFSTPPLQLLQVLNVYQKNSPQIKLHTELAPNK